MRMKISSAKCRLFCPGLNVCIGTIGMVGANHWNGNGNISTKFASLAALWVVKVTTFTAVSDENFTKMTFLFQCFHQQFTSDCINSPEWLEYKGLTHRGRVTHICVSQLGQHWLRLWLVASSAPSQYYNQCWITVNWNAVGHISVKY